MNTTEWDDASSADYTIVGGTPVEVLVVEEAPGAQEQRFIVSGESVPRITRAGAEDMVAAERERCAALARDRRFAGLADRLWQSEEVMSLNAELGLTMDQLVRLAKAILKA